MSETDYDIKLIYSNLCIALQRNLNQNFRSISFEILNDKNIQVKIILYNSSYAEEDLIEDFIGELAALSSNNNILPPIVTTRCEQPLKYLFYELCES